MDLAVLLPLSLILALQCLIGIALLLPRAVSKPVASLLASLSSNTATKSALLTIAGAVAAMTLSAFIQLMSVLETLKQGRQLGDRCAGLWTWWCC